MSKTRAVRLVIDFLLQMLARVTLAAWFGGFTFYAAVVVPDLHENLGGMETGAISRRVAPFLYEIGAAALTFGWLVAAIDRAPGWRGKARLGLLSASTLLLITLYVMHRWLEVKLDFEDNLRAFRSLHEVYLTVWTGEWLAILGLLALDALPRIPEKGEGWASDVAE